MKWTCQQSYLLPTWISEVEESTARSWRPWQNSVPGRGRLEVLFLTPWLPAGGISQLLKTRHSFPLWLPPSSDQHQCVSPSHTSRLGHALPLPVGRAVCLQGPMCLVPVWSHCAVWDESGVWRDVSSDSQDPGLGYGILGAIFRVLLTTGRYEKWCS